MKVGKIQLIFWELHKTGFIAYQVSSNLLYNALVTDGIIFCETRDLEYFWSKQYGANKKCLSSIFV